MNNRIWVRDVNGSLHVCDENDPGAVAFDRASSKETHLGRVNRLVAALNASLTLTPDKRVISWGTRLEVRDANGHYGDQGVDNVAEFHTAFDAHIAPQPHIPWAAPFSQDNIDSYHTVAATQGELLKVWAQEARDDGDEGGALLLIRLQLIQEELAELAEAMRKEDIVGCLDALCDLSYVVDGTYLTLGLGHYKVPGCQEVHRSNMSKLGPDGKAITSSAGRVVKGPNYTRPDLAGVLGLEA